MYRYNIHKYYINLSTYAVTHEEVHNSLWFLAFANHDDGNLLMCKKLRAWYTDIYG